MSGSKPTPKRKIPLVGIVLGVVAVLLVAAVVLSGNTGPTTENGEPVITGESLPRFPGSSVDPAVGVVAPAVAGQSFDGDAVTIEPGTGPTAIAFLAHWCRHCRNEVPRVQAWLDDGGGVDGVRIVSVSTSVNSAQANFPPSDWLASEGWTPPVIKDDVDSSTYVAYGAGGFPFWVFLNGDGTVAARTAGELEIATLQSIMETLTP